MVEKKHTNKIPPKSRDNPEKCVFFLCFFFIPSDTKLLLTKNYSEIIIFGKITNLTRNSLKMSFFPGHFESTKSLKYSEK